MDEKSLKANWWQRVIILIIAILLLGSTIFAYMFIVMSGNKNTSSSSNQEELIAELTESYDAKKAELEEAAKPFSDKYFTDFLKYNSQIKSYNSAAANAAGIETTDLKTGTGKTLAEGDTDYLAYYIGWCPDGSVFDSSFNYANETEKTNPTSLTVPLDPSAGMIEGWNQGVIGMKLGGVRQLTISKDLAYAGNTEMQNPPCGSTDTPLKFIVFAFERDETISRLNSEFNEIFNKLIYAYYGNVL